MTSLATSQDEVRKNLWQHPYVDIFNHFNIMPVQDWKSNKAHGDVHGVYVSLIIPLIYPLLIGQGNR